jgi:superfamily II DNA or RNA helicase
MTKIVTIAHNAVNARLHNPTVEVKLIVQTALSYKVEGSEQSIAYKQNKWDGRSSFFQYKTASFPAGFVAFVSSHLKKKGYEVRIARNPLPEPLGPARPKVSEFGYTDRYDYQPETVDRLVKYGAMIAQIATGGGKSITSRIAFARIGRPTLFLTTRSLLMYQMKDAFEKEMGVQCSVFGDGQFGETNAAGQLSIKKMSVGMVQTFVSKLEETNFEKEFQAIYDAVQKQFEAERKSLVKELTKDGLSKNVVDQRLKMLLRNQDTALKTKASQMKERAEKKFKEKEAERQKTIKLLAMFEFVILEEAHEASGNSYYDIMRHCKNANYRLALTATPFMKDSEESNMRLMACSGMVGIRVTEKMLIDRGILAKPYFKVIELKKKPDNLMRSTGWQAAYRIGIKENEERNMSIVAEVRRGKSYGLTAMVLVQHTAHGEHLAKLMEKHGVRAEFISGDSSHDERKYALNRLAKGEIDALVGTTILDVGVDVPAVGMVILAGGGKAEVAMRQRIGRGLRAKKLGPNVAFVVDFSDGWNSYTKDHAQQRLDIIKSTPGFAENLVTDFDFESLGFNLISKVA